MNGDELTMIARLLVILISALALIAGFALVEFGRRVMRYVWARKEWAARERRMQIQAEALRRQSNNPVPGTHSWV